MTDTPNRPDRGELERLLDQVRALTRPSREVDAAIFDALIGVNAPDAKRWYGGGWDAHISGSADAALALVERLLPGWSWKVVREPAAVSPNCAVLRNAGKLSDIAEAFVSSHRTAPLALITALLAALIHEASK